jgi:K+-transporting ATPase ATPase C chain
MSNLRPAIVLIALFTLLTGLALPLGMTGIGSVLLPGRAGGSLLERDGHVVGSALLGQDFAADQYFHPRPSATTDADPADASKTVPSPYRADSSNASNLAPTSKALIDRVTADVQKLGQGPVPADAVTTSASGLDPDISPENADRQVARVAAARNLPEARVRSLLIEHTSEPALGVFGQPRVNVLELNLALDAAAPAPAGKPLASRGS